MKKLIALFLILTSFFIHAQSFNLENCGQDQSPLLNKDEGAYFNHFFSNRKGDLDFQDKKAAFVSGSSGKTILDKTYYFHRLGDETEKHEWQAGGTQLLLLSSEEKELSGGYDVVFVYWSKLPCVDKRRENLIASLKKKQNRQKESIHVWNSELDAKGDHIVVSKGNKIIETNSPEELIDKLNENLSKYDPEIVYQKFTAGILQITLSPESKYSEQMGTAGANQYLVELIFTLTELSEVQFVQLNIDEGSHGKPGRFTRADFESDDEYRILKK